MNGYVDAGKSPFQQDLYSYLASIRDAGFPSSVNCFFVNDRTVNKGSDIDAYINSLTPRDFNLSQGNRTATDLADIFCRVLENTSNDTVSVFVSDCIFSPGKNVNNPESYLRDQQTKIRSAVSTYISEHKRLAVMVYQCFSSFSGRYYDYQNNPSNFSGERPYYIWVFGHPQQLSRLRGLYLKGLREITIERFPFAAVEHQWCAFNSPRQAKYSILPFPRKGEFDLVSGQEIRKVKKDENGEFMFTIGADLTDLDFMLGNEYLLDSKNYAHVLNKNTIRDNDDWLAEISLNSNDKAKATHNISITFVSPVIAKGDRTLALICRVPSWAYNSSDSDDSELTEENSRKTYGLKYIFEGIEQAFNASGITEYTEFQFKLN